MLLLVLLLHFVLELLEDVGGDDEEPFFLDGKRVVILGGHFLRPQVREYLKGSWADVLVDVDEYLAVVFLVS